MTLDGMGRLIVCEHSTHSLVRMAAQGTGAERELIATHFAGRELNSPNDVVVHSDGSLWFTDPPGGRNAAFGVDTPRQLDFQGLFCLEPDGPVRLIADDFDMPNGLCFSPCESRLYVNDSNRSHIPSFELGRNGTVLDQGVFLDNITTGNRADGWVDGMKCDQRGNVWVTGPRGIWVIDPSGRHLGTVRTPEAVLNLHWGGPKWSTLYITGMSTLYRIETRTTARREPFMSPGVANTARPAIGDRPGDGTPA